MDNKNAYLRKDGRWEVRLNAGIGTDGKRKYHSIYGRTKEEAEKKASCMSYVPCYPIQVPLTEMTVRELAAEYIDRKAPLLKVSTLANYTMKAEKHIYPAFGDRKCTDITAADIYSFMDLKRNENLSERYIYDNIVLLKSIFRYANITYQVKNILEGIVMPKRSKSKVEILNDSEQEQLKAHISSNFNLTSLAVSASLYTGIRIGELCALQWNDIDLEKRILTVNKTIQRIHIENGAAKTKLVITAPKSQSSVREIPIPECLVEMLKKNKGSGDDYLISGTDKPVEPRTLQYRFARMLHNANLPSVHFHSLRHAFATNCVAMGFDVKTLSEILGHSSVEITLNRYVHSSMDRKKAFMDKLTWNLKVSA